jgi:hypothetical protein
MRDQLINPTPTLTLQSQQFPWSLFPLSTFDIDRLTGYGSSIVRLARWFGTGIPGSRPIGCFLSVLSVLSLEPHSKISTNRSQSHIIVTLVENRNASIPVVEGRNLWAIPRVPSRR